MVKNFFETKLKVYTHEFPQFLWVSLIFFCLFSAMAVFRNYVDTAFFKRYGVEHIPLMLVINGILTFFLFAVMNRIGRRARDYVLLSGFLIINSLVVAGVFLLIQGGASLVYPVLFQLLYLQDSVFLVYLWNIAADFFDARQGKRIFPLITAGQVLGTTVGNFCTRPLTVMLGRDLTLLVFSGACLAIALFIIRTAGPMIGPRGPEKTAGLGPQQKLSEIPRLVKQFPIIRYLIVIGLIPNILLPVFAYQFSIIANAAFPSEQSLISFLGFFRGGMTLAVFLLLLIAGRLYARMGLVNAAFVHPINFTLVFGGLFAFFNIYMAAYGQFAIHLIQRCMAGPVGKVLFNIVPNELRNWSRVFVRSTVIKVGMMLGSLMMLILKPIMAPQYLAVIAGALAGYWVIETIIFSRHYKRGLKQVIVEDRIDFDRLEAACAVEYGPGLVHTQTGIVDEKEEDALSVVAGVPRLPPDAALKLLSDPNPDARAEAALSLTGCSAPHAIKRLTELLNDQEAVRTAAIEALVVQGRPALAFLESALMDGSYRSRRGILEVLRLSGLKDFEITPFMGLLLTEAYNNLIALEALAETPPLPGRGLLCTHIGEKNREILSLVFHALWVRHADMRLMYEALHTSEAAVALELVESTVDRGLTRFLIPLIDAVPAAEKIQKGRKVLPLITARNPERILTWLAGSRDATTRMLAAYVIGESGTKEDFYPTLEVLQDDEDKGVRQTAHYAVNRYFDEVADMPEIIEMVNRLRDFIFFDGMGIRELQAVASIATLESFQAGEVIVGANEDNFALYLLLKGRIRIYRDYGTGDERTDNSIGPGGFVGEIRLFTGVPDDDTSIAVEPTEALVIRRNHFQGIMKIYPQIAINLCLFFALRLATADMKPQ